MGPGTLVVSTVHVCQRWRNLILGSAFYLRLSLVCTHGTPVENMLAHSPPLPLTVDYQRKDGITAEDEEGILLALEQRHRVRHLRLASPIQNLQKIVMAIDKEFPILEYLILATPIEEHSALMLPKHFKHQIYINYAGRLAAWSNTISITPDYHGPCHTLLATHHQSAYFQPNVVLQWISFMPQLESLDIWFAFAVPNRDVERQLTHTAITTPITLPNLRLFSFRGVSTYLESVVCRITTPRLEILQIRVFEQLTFSFPYLLQFMNTAENLRFDNAVIRFQDKIIDVQMFFREAAEADTTYPFGVTVDCWHLDWQGIFRDTDLQWRLAKRSLRWDHLTLEHKVP